MTKLGTYIIRLLFMSFLPFTAMIEALIKKNLCDSNFEIHFLREQYKSIFWNAFFMGAILNNYFR